LNLDRLLPWHGERLPIPVFDELLAAEGGTVIIKTHTASDLRPFQIDSDLHDYVQAIIDSSRIVYVYRDGRDVMVSLYHYMKHYDQDIRTIPFSDFIRMPNRFDAPQGSEPGLSRVEYWGTHVEGWLKHPDIQAVSYEELHQAYEATMNRVAEYASMTLGKTTIPIRPRFPTNWLLRVGLRATALLGRDQHSTAILPRKGVIGEWRRHFSQEDIEFFERHTGRLLMELGYS
jgi:hypothetical protein